MPQQTVNSSKLPDSSLKQIFLEARTHSNWTPEPISEAQLRELYDLLRLGPTSANMSPARFIFVQSKAAKERLLPAVAPGNVEKCKTAPVVAIVAWDAEFYEKLPKLFPHADARSWFVGNKAFADEAAFRNSSLQGAYMIIAARALRIDCGPMSGFDADKLNAEFFPDGKWKANFICAMGHGDKTKIHPRLPRLDFEEACKIL